MWHGITREANAAEYLRHVEMRGIPAIRRSAGNRGAFALYRVSNGVAEFLVISLWESMDAVRAFVGSDDITRAVYFPEDRSYLQFPEPKVTHYQLASGEDFLRMWSEAARPINDPFSDTS